MNLNNASIFNGSTTLVPPLLRFLPLFFTGCNWLLPGTNSHKGSGDWTPIASSIGPDSPSILSFPWDLWDASGDRALYGRPHILPWYLHWGIYDPWSCSHCRRLPRVVDELEELRGYWSPVTQMAKPLKLHRRLRVSSAWASSTLCSHWTEAVSWQHSKGRASNNQWQMR